jgi:CheY-like chemotaxis protein
VEDKMPNLSEDLLELNFKRIAIVDDTPENIEAAKEAVKKISGIEFTFCNSASEILQLISDHQNPFDLIITDLCMETEDAGLSVVENGFNNGIFVVVASGGYQHNNTPIIRLAPDSAELAIEGDKNSPDTWVAIISAIIDASMRHTSILSCFDRLRKSGADIKELGKGVFPLGQHVRMTMKGRF